MCDSSTRAPFPNYDVTFLTQVSEITVDESLVQSQLAIMSGVNPINLLYYHRNSMANARSS